jgi:hypothetical protein
VIQLSVTAFWASAVRVPNIMRAAMSSPAITVGLLKDI